MLSSIYVGMTGLQGYSQGLRVIANNTANVNTPGFKSSSLQFADMFYSTSGSGTGLMQVGYGLGTAGTTLNFRQGELRQTGNALDLALDGQGLFTLRDAGGNLHYTRAGQFMFDAEGVLVNRADGSKVMGVDSSGAMGEISLAGRASIEGRPSSTLVFGGNLSSTADSQTISGVKAIDRVGGEHLLTVKLTNDSATVPGQWNVELLDGATSVGSGKLLFSNGRPVAGSTTVSITYTPPGLAPVPLVLDFGSDVTSFAAGSLSTLAFRSQDGFAPGELTGASFDEQGKLVLAYANGQTGAGPRLALGRFDSLDAVAAAGTNAFDATDTLAWHVGFAADGGFGKVRSGMVELSNVDLSQEFSDLVIMQRGYQASSQIISTANEMLQELFNIRRR